MSAYLDEVGIDASVALHSLQGALGKTSGRSYKAAPRQLLQVVTGISDVLSTSRVAHVSTLFR
jgi:hypothetical protein